MDGDEQEVSRARRHSLRRMIRHRDRFAVVVGEPYVPGRLAIEIWCQHRVEHLAWEEAVRVNHRLERGNVVTANRADG